MSHYAPATRRQHDSPNTLSNNTFAGAQFTVDALAKDAALAAAATPLPLPALRAAAEALAPIDLYAAEYAT